MHLTEVLGWIGSLGLLTAYGLLTVGRWDGTSMRYQVANAVFAFLLFVWAVSISAWQAALLNIVWTAVGVVGIARMLRRPVVPVPEGGD